MSFLLFVVSALLLLGTAAHVTRCLPAVPGSRLWTFLAAVSVQLSVLHMGVSLFHQLTPTGFLAGQLLLAAAAFGLFQFLSRRFNWQPAPLLPGDDFRQLLADRPSRDPFSCALVLSILLVLGLSLTEQMLRPVTGFDERMYNCSRVVYWHQHKHIWPWITQNEAQLDLPFGAEVFFSWPLLFTKIEWTARLIFWLGFPTLIAGVYTLARAMGSTVRTALISCLIIAATPGILVSAGINQKQDIWTSTFLVGIAYWSVQLLRSGSLSACLWSGVFLALAANVKVTNIAVTPVVALAAIMSGPIRAVPKRFLLQTIGGISGILLSGLAITFAHNTHQYGNPISSPGSKKVIQPDFSVKQTYTHAIRIPATLIELPEQPIESIRTRFEELGTKVINKLGAGEPLRLEDNPIWPGAFKFSAGPVAYRYSMGGTVWLVMLVVGFTVGVRQLFTQRLRFSPDILILCMSGVLLASLGFMIRWMGGAAERYWIAPYSLGIPASIALLTTILRGRPLLIGAAFLLIPLTVYPAARTVLQRIDTVWRSPPSAEASQEPFTEAITHMPPGSRIILFGHRNARDYGLFRPADLYANQVFPYGKNPKFDPARVARMIQDNDITHIIFEDDAALGFHWDGGFRVEEITQWLDRRGDFRIIPLKAPNQRLYQRTQDPAAAIVGFGGWSYPEGLDPVEGPYPDLGPTIVRWGVGTATTLRFTSQGEPLTLHVEGKRSNEPNQTITISLNGAKVGSHTFNATDREWHKFVVPLSPKPGPNLLTLAYSSNEGDRHLAVLYRTLHLMNSEK